jgi:chaperonin cofactor prefoldin
MPELKFHPLADLFPLMEGVEFDALVTDIKANGQIDPIVLHEGMILDGRNRYRACLAAGARPRTVEGGKFGVLIDDPVTWVISANIHRRHLTAEQKRELIARLLKADPEKSDRQIAGTVKASPTFVGKVRAEKEATGDVSTVDTRVDTKGRKQPAKKDKIAKPKSKIAKLDKTSAAREAQARAVQDVGPTSNGELERLRARNEELENKIRRLEIENVGLRSEVERLKAKLAGSGLAQVEKPKRGRGRPKGSKNKPKPPVTPIATGNDPGPMPERLRRDRVQP